MQIFSEISTLILFSEKNLNKKQQFAVYWICLEGAKGFSRLFKQRVIWDMAWQHAGEYVQTVQLNNKTSIFANTLECSKRFLDYVDDQRSPHFFFSFSA